MNEVDGYDFDESIGLAEALQKKAEKDGTALGLKKDEAKKLGIKKYNEVRRNHVIEFLYKIKLRLADLTNQSIANLIKALIALGLSFDDDEELEYYINLLTQESLNRLTFYFEQRGNASIWKQLSGLIDVKEAMINLDNYSALDIAALSDMIKSLKKINKHAAKNVKTAKRRDKLLGKVDKILLNDLKTKQDIIPNRMADRNLSQLNENPLDILKAKMVAEGVEVGGRYWNSIVAEFDAETDKNNFAKNWSLDNQRKNETDIQKINELRGVKEDIRKKKQETEIARLIQQETKDRENRLQQSREQQNQEKNRQEAIKQANKKLIQKELKNEKNKKAAEHYAEKKEQKEGKPLNEKDIKKMKLKAVKGKGR